MDTVTDENMAIAMAKMGGISFLHRFITIEENIRQVQKVKRYHSHVIDNPYHITPDATVEDADNAMYDHSVGGMMVAEEGGPLLGIITKRDIYGERGDKLVTEAMTPIAEMVTGTHETSPSEAKDMMHARRVEKLPLLDKEGICTGLIVMKDIRRLADNPRATLDASGRLAVGGSIGVVGDYLERLDALVEAGVDVVVIDVAHGWADHVLKAVREVRARHKDLPLVVGNVATGGGLEALTQAAGLGAGVRCGIGNGSGCDTRQVAGSGLPIITSIMDCVEAARRNDAYIIADGGIRIAADVAKAIGAGAHTVMLGSLLASAEEAPGDVVKRDGQRYRVYRGMASLEAAQIRWKAEGRLEKLQEDFTPEGIESVVKYHGDSAEQIVKPLIGGLKSGMSYSGARTVDEFHEKARFTRMTQAGLGESSTHVQGRK